MNKDLFVYEGELKKSLNDNFGDYELWPKEMQEEFDRLLKRKLIEFQNELE